MEARNLTCINCPLGCQIKVTMSDGEITSIEGNTCPRGKAYAEKEVTHPTRIVTSTVRVNGGKRPVVAVKTASDISKEKIFEVMEEINNVNIDSPIYIGDVIIPNVAGTGVPVVATANV